jgi:hypothetical protein
MKQVFIPVLKGHLNFKKLLLPVFVIFQNQRTTDPKNLIEPTFFMKEPVKNWQFYGSLSDLSSF